jgi:hypothetical protein
MSSAALAQVEKTSGKKPDRYTDLRKLLEDKSIDAISIATPNRNHTECRRSGSRRQAGQRRDTIGRAKPEPVPAGVHYNLWLRRAPKTESTRNRFRYNWHWFWD